MWRTLRLLAAIEFRGTARFETEGHYRQLRIERGTIDAQLVNGEVARLGDIDLQLIGLASGLDTGGAYPDDTSATLDEEMLGMPDEIVETGRIGCIFETCHRQPVARWHRESVFEVFDEVDAIERRVITDGGPPEFIETPGICQIVEHHLLPRECRSSQPSAVNSPRLRVPT